MFSYDKTRMTYDVPNYPLQADLFITDCARQDLLQFSGQYVWTVEMRLWRGPRYPRLGDDQFYVKFDIPADWASDGWRGQKDEIGMGLPLSLQQQMVVVDMMQRPVEAAAWLMKQAVDHDILEKDAGMKYLREANLH